eukprot:10649052-Alexandrium_andersonii.AAC.1
MTSPDTHLLETAGGRPCSGRGGPYGRGQPWVVPGGSAGQRLWAECHGGLRPPWRDPGPALARATGRTTAHLDEHL